MHIGIVILNWNTKSYLERFLPPLIESVEAFNDFANSRSAEIIVADSASTDGSIALVRSEFPFIRTIALDRNYGFTGGYNRAIKEIIDHPSSLPCDFFVLLNSDIEVERNWLAPLSEWMM